MGWIRLLSSSLLGVLLFGNAKDLFVQARCRHRQNATATVKSEESRPSHLPERQVDSTSQDRSLPTTSWWRPKASANLTWQWVLQGTIDTNYDVDVYDVDLFDTPKSTIQALQRKGIRVICYFSAGTYEGWRPDWKKFFPFITGDSYSGSKPPFAGKMDDWDERWLDIRQINLLRPIMTSRLQMAVNKGCDGVEPDNMDAFQNLGEVKKPIKATDQLKYNRFIADAAHNLSMSVGLKNDVGQLASLVGYYDFAVNEQCFQYNECAKYTSTFVAQDKPVFGVEYQGDPAVFCPQAQALKLSFQKKRLSLRNWRIGCENY